MSALNLSGSKLRAARMALGLRQGDVARAAGLSASYLNLIEHNRRRVPPDVLDRLAAALGQSAAALADGGGTAALDDLRSAALAWPSAELARVDEFAQRFPGWADAVLAMHQRSLALEGALAAVNDRMSHDPHLPATLHEVLSAVASVRSTAVILAETDDLEPEWQTRFLRNLDQDSARLAKGAEALVRYLDSGGLIEAQGTAAPQEEVEAWAGAQNWQIEAASNFSGLSNAARAMAQDLQAVVRADLAALPEAPYRAALAVHEANPLAIAAACAAPPLAAFRRLAFDPTTGAGLVACDGSGTLVLRRPVAGFSVPRFGAACPLWPLFTALGRPLQPITSTGAFGEGGARARFVLHAFCQTAHPMGYAGPELRSAMMLIVPTAAANDTADAAAAVPDLALGSSCRVCPRKACPARREPSILAGAFDAPAPLPRAKDL
jgi:transcriptional regulator with XRE-family HTH domain